MDYSQFIPAFAMNESIRKGGDSFESLPYAFKVSKGNNSICYTYACFEVSESIDVSSIDLDCDCAFLLFPNKSGNNVIILTTEYIRSIIEDNKMPLRHIDKTKILYTDRYEFKTRNDDLLNESESKIFKKQDLDIRDH